MVIFLEPESVRACCIQLFGLADEVEQQAIYLLSVARSMDWYSPSRDTFQYEIEKKAQQMVYAAEEARLIALKALRSMETLQEIDVAFEREFADILQHKPLSFDLQVNR